MQNITIASYFIWDVVTTRVLWGCVVRAMEDGDLEVAYYFAHILADLASA